MKQGIRTAVDWELVGAELARESDREQIQFFKAFVKECNSWGTQHQVEMQLAGINIELTKDEIETLGMITYEKEDD